jgi:hypothetical protein
MGGGAVRGIISNSPPFLIICFFETKEGDHP